MKPSAAGERSWTARPASRLWLVGAVLLAAFLLRVLCMFIFGSSLHADEGEMGTLARNILAGKGYQLSLLGPEQPTAAVMPFEGYFFALGHWLFGYTPLSYAMLILFRCAVSVATAYIVYRLVRSEMSEHLAMLALIVTAFHPLFIYYAAIHPVLSRGPISGFAVVLVVGSLLYVARHPSLPRSLLAGIIYGLGLLVQANLLIAFPLVWCWMGYVLWRPRDASVRGRKWTLLVAMPLAMMVVVAPWTIRNYHALGGFVALRTGFGTLFWIGNNPMATGDFSQVPKWDLPRFKIKSAQTLPPEVLNKLPQMSEIERDRVLLRESLAFVVAHPGHFFKLTLTRLRFFWLGLPRQFNAIWKQVAYNLFGLYSVLVGVLALSALLFRCDRVVVLFLLVVFSFMLMYGLVAFGYYYYRMDSEILCLILVLFTCQMLWQWWQARREARQALSA